MVERRQNLVCLGALSSVAMIAGCGALIGLDDLTRTGDLDASVVEEGGSPGEGGNPDVIGSGCASGYDCVLAPPGWQPIAFDSNGRSSCPGDDSARADIQAQQNGNTQCTCTCSGTNCNGGTDIYLGTGSCPGSPTASGSLNQACKTITNPGTDFTNYRITGGTPGGACTPSVPNFPAPTNGRICTSKRTCPGGACAPKGNGFQSCIQQSGDQTCPQGFHNKWVVGDSINDSRTCAGCTCGSPSCRVQVSFWNNPNCNGNADFTASSDGGCQTTAGQQTARTFTSTLSTSCSVVTQPTLQGTRNVSGQSTVCCP